MRYMKSILRAGFVSAIAVSCIAEKPASAQYLGVQAMQPVYGQSNVLANPQQIIPYNNNTAYANSPLIIQTPASAENGTGQANGGFGQPAMPFGSQAGVSSEQAQHDSGGAPALGPAPVAGSKEAEALDKAAASARAKELKSSTNLNAAVALQVGDRLTGTPHAINGVTLAFGAGVVRLDSVVAPGVDVACRSGATAWRCGLDSRDTLQNIVDNRPVSCIVTASSAIAVARCTSGIDDIAAMLVERGAVFDELGHFPRELAAAKANHLGIWAQ